LCQFVTLNVALLCSQASAFKPGCLHESTWDVAAAAAAAAAVVVVAAAAVVVVVTFDSSNPACSNFALVIFVGA